MAPHTNGASRTGSGHASRAASAARDIVKKRDKPYKTEQQLILAKKKKLNLHTSYANPPPGYTFLPVGTPELAERCKELSRQKGVAVNVVNAKPVSRYAHNPLKVSHHVHRIGYHFKAEVVDEACAQLGYILHRGQFVKEADLQEQRKKDEWARTLARYNVPFDLSSTQQRESSDQVRAAIKELFPKIPDQDLSEIVKHAWEEGTDRVGNMKNLELSRRVQLATIARIRHTYTDYDRLLRAFDWKEARSMVEPECLRKLIEWRGENDEDDEGLEEIVRETIVIDDDNDEDANGSSEADDDDESGDISDTDIEITHHVANDDDFGAESTDERAKAYINRLQPRSRKFALRNNIAKQKIDATRQRLRGTAAQAQVTRLLPAGPQEHSRIELSSNVPGLQMHSSQHRQAPREVIGNDGKKYILVPAGPMPQDQRPSQHQTTASTGAQYYPRIPLQAGSLNDAAQPYSSGRPTRENLQDWPVASIERDDYEQPHSAPRSTTNGRGPATPDSGLLSKRRHIERSPPIQGRHVESHRPAYTDPPAVSRGARIHNAVPVGVDVMDITTPDRGGRGVAPADVDVMDLTSPNPQVASGHSSPYVSRETRVTDQYGTRPYMVDNHRTHGSAVRNRPFAPSSGRAIRPVSHHFAHTDPLPYDPTQPVFQSEQHERALNGRVVQLPAGTADVQYAQPCDGYVQTIPTYGKSDRRLQDLYAEDPVPGYTRVIYQTPEHMPPSRPVHGAPAPVQLVPINTPPSGYSDSFGAPRIHSSQPVENRPEFIPANGAVAPTQYFYPR